MDTISRHLIADIILWMLFLLLGVLLGVGIIYLENKKEVQEKPLIEAYDYVLDNINEIKYQEIETTYHNYIVIIDKGKVVENGVIHTHKCKCRDRTVQ